MPIGAFHWSSGVTLLVLLVYFWVTGKTGQARLKYGVKAPMKAKYQKYQTARRPCGRMVKLCISGRRGRPAADGRSRP